MREQGMRGAVELRNRDDILAELGDVEHRIIQGGLPGTDAERLHAAFEGGNAAIEHVGGRIADAAVAIAVGFQVEQGGAVFGAVEAVGDGLVDRNGDRPGCRIAVIPAVQCDRFPSHRTYSGRNYLIKMIVSSL